MAAAPSTPAPAAAVPAPAPTQPRVIPGFKPAATAEAKKARSRPKKTPKGPSDVAGAVAADGVATTETAPTADALSTPLIAQVESEEEVIEEKKTAVEAVQKRLRAANKKIVSPPSPASFFSFSNDPGSRTLASSSCAWHGGGERRTLLDRIGALPGGGT